MNQEEHNQYIEESIQQAIEKIERPENRSELRALILNTITQ